MNGSNNLVYNMARTFGLAALAVCAVLALASCASMSEQECLTADWRLMGYTDAMEGRSTATISQHRRACAAVSVVPDLDLYQYGHEEGARQYCTAANGYRVGSNGTNYQSICPADLEYLFLDAYQDGRKLYDITKEISDLETEMRKDESLVKELRRDIEKLEKAIVDDDTTAAERRAKLAEISALGDQISNLEVDVSQARRSISRLEMQQYYMREDHRLLGY